ncbi:MAG: thiamine diphosphokinase [Anaerolinea sp.]|nr:thiamine diphosphokinase [Anaerolinea sp.]
MFRRQCLSLPRSAARALTRGVHALLIAHGEAPSTALLRILAGVADLVVAADGGVSHALAAGIKVDAVVGDLDSLTAEQRSLLGPGVVEWVQDADTTDLQKAIAYAIARGAVTIDIVATGGGRVDHALANLSVLLLSRGKARLRIIDDQFEVSLVEGVAVIEGEPGTVVSLVAIGQAEGVTTTGMRWDLDDYPLAFSPYGIHNELRTSPARVTVRRGDVLLFRGRWVEKHR